MRRRGPNAPNAIPWANGMFMDRHGCHLRGYVGITAKDCEPRPQTRAARDEGRHGTTQRETAPKAGAVGPGLITLAGCAKPMPLSLVSARTLMERVIVYVDGMNLYYGLRAKHGRRYLWLNVGALAQALLQRGQRIERVRYFTARVRDNVASQQRQEAYLLALETTCPELGVVEGRFQERVTICRWCGTSHRAFEEKETDVNIAAAVVRDAARDGYDMAMLITADADLCPAIRVARELAPQKRFIAAFPPRRRSDALRRTADGAFTIGDSKIRSTQLPELIRLPNGGEVRRPNYWRAP